MVRLRYCGALAAFMFALAPSLAAGQTSEILYACLSSSNGGARLVGALEECRTNETRVQWNIVGARGPQGEQGPPGVKGDTGAPGATGATGLRGETGAVGPQGATGATGETGEKGAVGPQGPSGLQGPAGPQGSPGPKGDKGEVGLTGTSGPQGAEGQPGPSGFVNVLSYEGSSTLGISILATSIPGQCQTSPYVAGANEIAILSTDLTYQSGGMSTIFLSQWINAGAGYSLLGTYAAGPLAVNAWGTLHNQAQLQLTQGTTYKFVAGIHASASANVAINFTCRGLVTIFRKQP